MYAKDYIDEYLIESFIKDMSKYELRQVFESYAKTWCNRSCSSMGAYLSGFTYKQLWDSSKNTMRENLLHKALRDYAAAQIIAKARDTVMWGHV